MQLFLTLVGAIVLAVALMYGATYILERFFINGRKEEDPKEEDPKDEPLEENDTLLSEEEEEDARA